MKKMSLSLFSDWVSEKSIFFWLAYGRLKDYIEVLKKELLELSYFRLDDALINNELRYFIDNTLLYLLFNEIIIDLYISYMEDDCRYKGRKDLENLIYLTYMKYAILIRNKIKEFNNNLNKLSKKY